MCHNCYHAWLRAGKPERSAWEPRRHQWLSEGPRRECLACGRGRGNGDFRFGLDFACYCSWHRAGRPDLDVWVPERRAWLEQHGGDECVVCFRPCNRLTFGMDERCYNAWRRAGRPDLDEWVPARRKWLGYRS